MIYGERTVVFLSDRLAPSWQQECEARDLSPESLVDTPMGVRDAIKSDPHAFLTLVDNPLGVPRERKHLLETIQASADALDRGVLPIMLIQGSADDWAYASQEIGNRFPNQQIGVDERFRPLVMHLGKVLPAAVLQRVSRHSSGRSHVALGINLAKGSEMHAADAILLRRAFNDYASIDIETLQCRGESYVYKVRVRSDMASGPLYYVVKSLPFSGVDQEIGILRNFLPRNTPFANVPPIVEDRCLSTSNRSALVAQFVDRAIVFSDFIESHSPALAVASLFDGPLRCWRSKATEEISNIVDFAIPMIIPGKSKPYKTAYEKAKSLNPHVRTPATLIATLRNQGLMSVKHCFSHGDLHLGNVFVREGSSEVVLIDFNRSADAPASRDPAELDAALGFGTAGDRSAAALPSDILSTLYSRPVLQPQVSCRTELPRAIAVEQVRRQAVGTCSEDEYRLMLACHCLWWAKHKNAEAYLAADRLT